MISWMRRKQKSVALSTTKAKHIAANMAGCEVVSLRNLFRELLDQVLDMRNLFRELLDQVLDTRVI